MSALIDKQLPFTFADNGECNAIWLTLTNLCNIHCLYCFNYVLKNNEHMPAEMALDIIQQSLVSLSNTSIPLYINYFGGEPTLNQKALLACVDFIHQNDIDAVQSLMTNGIFNDNLLEKLLSKNIQFQVSFDGSHNNLRLNKRMTTPLETKTIETIEKLSKANEQVTIRATIHRENVGCMVELVEFCHEKKVKNLKLAPICDFGEAKEYLVKQPDMNQYCDNFSKARALAYHYGINISTTGSFLSRWKVKQMDVPLVWLPDGKASMTITYASSKAGNFSTTAVGEIDPITKDMCLDETRILEMKEQFIRNREKYCSKCPIREICCGNLHFTPFATNSFVPERDRYFCHLAQRLALMY
jgi:sulfatase maturation enzyme AslB (radical SAM superfamily)